MFICMCVVLFWFVQIYTLCWVNEVLFSSIGGEFRYSVFGYKL